MRLTSPPADQQGSRRSHKKTVSKETLLRYLPSHACSTLGSSPKSYMGTVTCTPETWESNSMSSLVCVRSTDYALNTSKGVSLGWQSSVKEHSECCPVSVSSKSFKATLEQGVFLKRVWIWFPSGDSCCREMSAQFTLAKTLPHLFSPPQSKSAPATVCKGICDKASVFVSVFFKHEH